jgi:hypothetical protein
MRLKVSVALLALSIAGLTILGFRFFLVDEAGGWGEKEKSAYSAELSIVINDEARRKQGVLPGDITIAINDFLKAHHSYRLSDLCRVKVKALDGKRMVPLEKIATVDVIMTRPNVNAHGD